MKNVRNIEWFREVLAPKFKAYKLEYKFFDEGDFGSLNQVEFNSEGIGGNVDFWEQGWLGIFVWNYETEKELLNILLKPEQRLEQEKALNQLINLLFRS